MTHTNLSSLYTSTDYKTVLALLNELVKAVDNLNIVEPNDLPKNYVVTCGVTNTTTSETTTIQFALYTQYDKPLLASLPLLLSTPVNCLYGANLNVVTTIYYRTKYFYIYMKSTNSYVPFTIDSIDTQVIS